ncbi:MAG: RluA family pseudouridine synthase [Phycisphaerales bacterium]|nr:RluA family pseudouridine synthase [Phycisphaerales bacterium]
MRDALDIVHESARFVVVNKPSGLLSVPGKVERPDLATRIGEAFPRATGPLVVHRLDMDTSGLIVFALDPDAHRHLSRQFECRLIEKAYVALLDGDVEGDRGEVHLPIRPDIDHRPLQIVDHVHGKPSVTRWSVRARDRDHTRVDLEPLTGRTHQLRVHMASGLGHPIAGDDLYGGSTAPRLMLHASRIRFVDPATDRRVEYDSTPDF